MYKNLSNKIGWEKNKAEVNAIKEEFDDAEFFCGMVDQRKAFSLFPAGTVVRDPHRRESPTRHEQGLNLRRI